MSSAIQSATIGIEFTLGFIAVAVSLSLLVAGVAALLEPEARNFGTVRLFCLAGICGASFCDAFGIAMITCMAYAEPGTFVYRPSVPTFVTLGLIYGAIGAFTGRYVTRMLNAKPADPPDQTGM